jgi:hypothetical protein
MAGRLKRKSIEHRVIKAKKAWLKEAEGDGGIRISEFTNF